MILKKAIVGIFLIITALSVGICALKTVDKSCDELIYRLDALEAALKSEDDAETNRQSVLLNALWEKKKTFFHIFSNHSVTAELEKDLGKLMYFVETKDRKSTLEACRSCRDDARHIKRSSEPSLSNIF